MASLLNRSLGEIKKSREVGSHPNQKPIFGKNRINETSDSWKHDLFDAQPIKESIVIDEARSPALLITNLHYDVSEAELEALFGQIGKIDRGPVIKFSNFSNLNESLHFSWSFDIHSSFTAYTSHPFDLHFLYDSEVSSNLSRGMKSVSHSTNRIVLGRIS
ncbi:uncharacterized protein MELLADRAFT_88164 [Melampsora larici-populina 98AG31]|uniref:RRM domain-containing protein n=1 Tax=Melampsora larici-populina (strain 98AG31 / pathotype 3-4-7) TaxID=747676 RepID=F4RQT7_MELLP|nr:uncharacterized protein MELLADRAFT_88164 [Melampsora larici-populina 98AG31]EGG05267.1 hypothetical protein MELLADRAFT_88164 [Melampsora larici-populina 98AG31]